MISPYLEQYKLTTKASAGFSSLSTGRWYEYCVKVTNSVLTLLDERVGLGGDDIHSTILISLFKGRVGWTTCSSLFKERVGLTKDGNGSTTLSTNGRLGNNLR